MGGDAKALLVLNPIVTKEWESSVKTYVEVLVRGRRPVKVVSVQRGPATIESYFDLGLAAAGVVHLLGTMRDELQGLAAVIINCFGDPGLSAARELADVPVLGAGESALHVAGMLGRRVSILAIGKQKVSFQPEPRMVVWGMEGLFGSLRGTGRGVEHFVGGPSWAENDLVAAAQRAVEEDGADVLVLGCTGMAGLAREVEAAVGVPVVEPLAAAVSLAELVADTGLSHSRRLAYREAPPKVRLWEGGV